MKNIKYVLLALAVIVSSGCSTNHSSKMEEILNPMQKKLVSFYKEHARYPNAMERNTLLTQSGCSISSDICQYSGRSFMIDSETNRHYEYRLKLHLGNTRCYTGLFKSGNSANVSCHQDSSLGLKQ